MRTETPQPTFDTLVTGHFREGTSYANWRPIGTTDYLLMLSLSGRGRAGHADGEMVLAPGDLVLLKPRTPHDYGTARGAAGWELLWVHFLPRPHWLPLLERWPETAPGMVRLELGGEESGLFESVGAALGEMHARALGSRPHREQFALCALEEALLWCDTAVPERSAARIDSRVQRAMDRLRERMAEPAPLVAIAAEIGLSVSRLGHLFRAQTGRTPQQFLEDARMARACQLLELTSRSIAAIAEEVGYASPFYFTLRFKKRMGSAPREWRGR